MIGLNVMSVICSVVKNVEVKYLQNGTTVGNFVVGWNNYSKGANERNEKACYIDVTLFGKQVDNLKQYLVKGARIGITGKLDQQSWNDQVGQKHTKHILIADSIQLLGGNSTSQQSQQQNGFQPNSQYQQNAQPQQYQQQQNGFQQGFGQNMSGFPEDVLF